MTLKAGVVVLASKPVGVDVAFGDIANYGMRNVYILPGAYNGDIYYTPVTTTLDTSPVYAYFYNPNSSAITLDWNSGNGGSGTLNINANSLNALYLDQPSGYRFASQGGEIYTAMSVVDADGTGTAYDWAYTMLSSGNLSDLAGIAWAPGSNNTPQNPATNYNPVWVTPTTNTTI